ncbi:MAG: GNAT family N-acetyltransferase [Oscillospiraceae bacterium]|nr:GNAT family N-acetyltransferase [Oscillospiraceae bacterium]
MRIREMTMDDYEGTHKLWSDMPGVRLNPPDDSKEGIGRYLRRNPGMSFVAEEGGEIVGTILSGHDGRRGYIYHAAVRASDRTRGIGSGLLDRALAALKAEGISRVALVAFKDNEVGNAFWEKRGFETREDLNYRNKDI